jgi:glycosyltransferase involved in cell wall biosynthesis
MAAGKPIVAARAGAAPEVVAQGLLAEPEDAESLAEAIARLHGDRELGRSLAESGLRQVEQFDAPRVARAFVEVVEKRLSAG